jgi:hypothetical protein
MKFDIGVIYMKLSICHEFRKNRVSYSCTSVKDVVEFLTYFPHFVTSVVLHIMKVQR